MTLVTCRLTAKNRDQLRTLRSVIEYGLPLVPGGERFGVDRLGLLFILMATCPGDCSTGVLFIVLCTASEHGVGRWKGGGCIARPPQPHRRPWWGVCCYLAAVSEWVMSRGVDVVAGRSMAEIKFAAVTVYLHTLSGRCFCFRYWIQLLAVDY